MAIAHWARGIRGFLLNLNNALQLQSETTECISNIASGLPCDLTLDEIYGLLGPGVDSCSITVELLVAVRDPHA